MQRLEEFHEVEIRFEVSEKALYSKRYMKFHDQSDLSLDTIPSKVVLLLLLFLRFRKRDRFPGEKSTWSEGIPRSFPYIGGQ